MPCLSVGCICPMSVCKVVGQIPSLNMSKVSRMSPLHGFGLWMASCLQPTFIPTQTWDFASVKERRFLWPFVVPSVMLTRKLPVSLCSWTACEQRFPVNSGALRSFSNNGKIPSNPHSYAHYVLSFTFSLCLFVALWMSQMLDLSHLAHPTNGSD